MRVLVTGNLGYVGVVLTPMLQLKGWDVKGLDSGLFNDCDYGGAPKSVPTLPKDIRNVTANDLEGFDAVVHLAGLSNDPLGDIDPALTDEINHLGTVNLARAAKSAGVKRFLFSSSCSNYGASEGGWLTETSPLNPVTPYAVSKVKSEEALDHLADSAFTVVSLRSATAYGFSPRIRFDLVVNNLLAWSIATNQVRLKSDGSAWRPLLHIEDMAHAFEVALEAPHEKVHRQAFNVGRNADCMQVRDIADLIAEEVPEAHVSYAPGGVADKRTYKVDCSKILELGFVPKWTVRKGIQDLRDRFRTHGVSVDEFEGSRYQRVAHVKHQMATGQFCKKLFMARGIAA